MTEFRLPDYDADSAHEFLTYLSPWREISGEPAWPRGWIFRGQQEDWPLYPKVFRPDGSAFVGVARRVLRSHEDRWLAERDALVEFFEIADQRGLVLPDDSQHLRSLVETFASSRGDMNIGKQTPGWIENDDILSLMALAQHYGIPTRLLDWTRSALIAAYFAAEGAVATCPITEASNPMVVWAFYFPELGKHDAVVRNDDPVRVVTAPAASNANLRAQRGVFTLLGWHYRTDEAGDLGPMDTSLARCTATVAADSAELISRCRMQKVRVPRREAITILKKLAQLDITPSSVYPGYGSIVADLKHRAMWETI